MQVQGSLPLPLRQVLRRPLQLWELGRYSKSGVRSPTHSPSQYALPRPGPGAENVSSECMASSLWWALRAPCEDALLALRLEQNLTWRLLCAACSADASLGPALGPKYMSRECMLGAVW